MQYTDEQKQEAVNLYIDVGTAEAARQTGVTARTINNWAQQAGATVSQERDKTEAAREALAAKNANRREHIRHLILEKAEDLLGRMDEPHADFKVVDKRIEQVEWVKARSGDVKNYAVAFAVLIDKYRLEMGETTNRTEISVADAESVMDAEIRRLSEQLGE